MNEANAYKEQQDAGVPNADIKARGDGGRWSRTKQRRDAKGLTRWWFTETHIRDVVSGKRNTCRERVNLTSADMQAILCIQRKTSTPS